MQKRGLIISLRNIYWKKYESLAKSGEVEFQGNRPKQVSRSNDDGWANEYTLTGKEKINGEVNVAGVDRILYALETRFSKETCLLLCSMDCRPIIQPPIEKMHNLTNLHCYYSSDIDEDQLFIADRLFSRLLSPLIVN